MGLPLWQNSPGKGRKVVGRCGACGNRTEIVEIKLVLRSNETASNGQGSSLNVERLVEIDTETQHFSFDTEPDERWYGGNIISTEDSSAEASPPILPLRVSATGDNEQGLVSPGSSSTPAGIHYADARGHETEWNV